MDDWVPEALGRLNLDSLIGLSVAAARALVVVAGGTLRSVAPGRAIGLPYCPGLVTVTAEDDLVKSVLGLQGRVPADYVATALARLDLAALVGLGVAEARSLVESAGGELCVIAPWNSPADVRPWRVNVSIAGERIVQVLGRG